jgi:hypothetical protein
LDVRGADAGHAAGRRSEPADRITKIVQICHEKNLTTPLPIAGRPWKARTHDGAALEPGFVLGAPVMMLLVMVLRMMVVVVVVSGECSRAGKNQQQQDGGKNLLHRSNLA